MSLHTKKQRVTLY